MSILWDIQECKIKHGPIDVVCLVLRHKVHTFKGFNIKNESILCTVILVCNWQIYGWFLIYSRFILLAALFGLQAKV